MNKKGIHSLRGYSSIQRIEKEDVQDLDVHFVAKVLLVGDSGCGKTSMISRHINETECKPGMQCTHCHHVQDCIVR